MARNSSIWDSGHSLPKSKFGLNIIPVSIKFTQCQATIRNCLKNSVNDDIRHIHEATSYGTNVQYDKYKTTREVLKDMRATTTDHITTKLTSQGFIIRAIWDAVMPAYKGLWLSTFDKMPRNIFNFCIRYLNNTLATNKNMFTWKKSASAQYSVCSAPQTLGHVIGGCAAHLNEGRYTWRHDSESMLDKSINDSDIFIEGFNREIFRSDHPSNTKVGGVCIYVREGLPVKRRTDLELLQETVHCDPANVINAKNLKFSKLIKL